MNRKSDKKVLMIATDWNEKGRNGKPGGVTHYRLHNPAKYLRQCGYEVDILGKDFQKKLIRNVSPETITIEDLMANYREFLKPYDVVITKVIDNPHACGALIAACKETETPLVIDMDDNFLEVTEDQPAYHRGYNANGEEGGHKRAIAAAFVSRADTLFCSTKPLADYMCSFLKTNWDVDVPAYVLPNTMDLDFWKPAKHKSDTIGWQGSVTHIMDIAQVIPAMVQLAEEDPNVNYEFIGGFHPDNFKETYPDVPDWFIDRISFIPGSASIEDFPEMLAKREWKLAIAPIVDNDFNRSKSHIKWMEYSVAGLPTLASAVYPYKEDIHGVKTIQEGKTGYLTDNDNWYERLKEVYYADTKEVAQNAKQYVENNWKWQDHGHLWHEAIQDVI